MRHARDEFGGWIGTIMVEKNRSFVQGTSQNGQVVRVSPYFAGDTRLTDGIQQVVTAEVVGNTLRLDEQPENLRTTINPNKMLPSRAFESATVRVNERKRIEELRRKQGILG